MQTQEDLRRLSVDYNQLAQEYALHRKVQPRVLNQLIRAGRVGSTTRVLEVGCGTGNYISALRSATGCAGWGIDPSIEMLGKAKEKAAEIDFKLGRAEQIEFQDNCFDLVFCVDVIHHVEDRAQFYREALRVLAPGGRVCTVTESSHMIQNRQPFAVYFPETVGIDLARYPQLQALKRLMEAAGFEEVRSKTVKFSFLHANLQDFRNKAYSCLHLISEAGFQHGLARMERDVRQAPIVWISRYAMVWGKKKGVLTGQNFERT